MEYELDGKNCQTKNQWSRFGRYSNLKDAIYAANLGNTDYRIKLCGHVILTQPANGGDWQRVKADADARRCPVGC